MKIERPSLSDNKSRGLLIKNHNHPPASEDPIMTTTNQDIVFFEEILGKRGRRMTLKQYQGRKLLHLRLYDENDCPTRKGVHMSVEEGKTLLYLIPEVLNALTNRQEGMFNITESIRLQTTKFNTVDIRLFWKPSPHQDFVPTKKGCPLNKAEFFELVDIMHLYAPLYFN